VRSPAPSAGPSVAQEQAEHLAAAVGGEAGEAPGAGAPGGAGGALAALHARVVQLRADLRAAVADSAAGCAAAREKVGPRRSPS